MSTLKQTTQQSPDSKSTSNVDVLKDQFQAAVAKTVEPVQTPVQTPTHKKIKVLYRSCCGCGCSWDKVTLTVPFESEFNSRDQIGSKDFDELINTPGVKVERYGWK